MAGKWIGAALVVASAVLLIMLLTGGGPLIPHVAGPITLAVIGTVLLVHRGKHE